MKIRGERIEENYPRGWFAAALSADVPRGGVKTVKLFGDEIVVYRGEDGLVWALDPTCPHLGAHLGAGRVEGTCIRCPFHGWLFDDLGRCVEVPYSVARPDVGVRAWPVAECDGAIMVWGPDGVPDWELPRAPTEGWSDPQAREYVFPSTPEEVLENSADAPHVVHVHGGREPRYVEPVEFRGREARLRLVFESPGHGAGLVGEWIAVQLYFRLHGLGYLELETTFPAVPLIGFTRFCVGPVDERTVRVLVLNRCRYEYAPAPPEVADAFFQAAIADFEKDVAVWSTKTRLERPLLVPGDGPIREFRRWAAQFR